MAKYDRALALKRYQDAKEYWNIEYDRAEEDFKFSLGLCQWDEADIKVRQQDGNPCLVLNQLDPYANQIINDIRQSRLAINVSPVDDNADVDTAEVIQGIIRNIEAQSKAQSAYITAAISAVRGGVGWIRIKTDYADNYTFDQEIFIERILDFRSVMIDPDFKRVDGADAEYGFVTHSYSKEEFERLFPNAEPISFDGVGDKDVTTVEYFEKCYRDDEIFEIALVEGPNKIINSEQKKTLDDDGTVVYEVLNSRKVQIPYVKHYVLNGEDDPIDETELVTEYIPLVPVFGQEYWVDDRREFHSLIRQGKDAQRSYNYWESLNLEIVKSQPKTPFVGFVGQFSSTPVKWTNANRKNYAFLEADLVYDKQGNLLPPPQRSIPPQGSPAVIQSAATARDNIMLALGMPRANMGQQGNEVSGIAIRSRQIEGDNATFHFIDNLAMAISQVGTILLDNIRNLYTKPQIKRILGEDSTPSSVPVNMPYMMKDGQPVPAKDKVDGIYRLGVGKYDVVCDVGASYSSKRQETADSLMQLIAAKPELLNIAGDILFNVLDVPMAKEIAERLRSQMPPELLGDDPMAGKLKQAAQAMDALQNQLMTYEAALKSKKDDEEFKQSVELKKLELDRQDLAIKAQKTAAEIEKMRAETTGFNMDAMMALGNAVQGIAAQVNDMGEAISIILDAKEQEGFSDQSEDMAEAEPEQSALQLGESDND